MALLTTIAENKGKDNVVMNQSSRSAAHVPRCNLKEGKPTAKAKNRLKSSTVGRGLQTAKLWGKTGLTSVVPFPMQKGIYPDDPGGMGRL